MKICMIEFEGTPKPGEKLPRAIATASRRRDGSLLVEINHPNSNKKHYVDPACEEDMLSMADCLAFHLEGEMQTSLSKYEYLHELQRLVNNS